MGGRQLDGLGLKCHHALLQPIASLWLMLLISQGSTPVLLTIAWLSDQSAVDDALAALIAGGSAGVADISRPRDLFDAVAAGLGCPFGPVSRTGVC